MSTEPPLSFRVAALSDDCEDWVGVSILFRTQAAAERQLEALGDRLPHAFLEVQRWSGTDWELLD